MGTATEVSDILAAGRIVTRSYLDARLQDLELHIAADMAKVHGDLAALRWGMAITIGGVVTLILKSFFPH
ncbi:MAG: hypothetical protein HQM03_01395 [Magnetococcales bacterium]|nr:hypothetical protein [Magnetococcales bacterium]